MEKPEARQLYGEIDPAEFQSRTECDSCGSGFEKGYVIELFSLMVRAVCSKCGDEYFGKCKPKPMPQTDLERMVLAARNEP